MIQKRHRKEERNPDLDPRLRLMEGFRIFFYETNRDSIMCPKGSKNIEVCIQFLSKGNCTCNTSRSHPYLRGQIQEEYIRFFDHCRSRYKAGNYNRKRQIRG